MMKIAFSKMTKGLLLFVFLVSLNANASLSQAKNDSVFHLVKPDYQLSPLTGMTRQHWMDAATNLLDGAFSYIHTLDDPMRFPKQPGKSYPTDGKFNKTENLEGLCRTMFVAIPLLKENPDLVLNGIKVGDYYRQQLRNMSDPSKSGYIQHLKGGPSQTLVEFGALALSLTVMPEIIWEPLTQKEKDDLAALMLSYGNGPTIGSNWRFFNIFVMSFFKNQGYEVKDGYIDELLQKSLAQYRGYGWYNDSPAYDYYSMWAFQMYGMIWAHYYGEKFNPEAGRQFVSNFRDLVPNYPYMFAEDGKMNMYGRSITYRIAAAVPFPLMGWLNDPSINYGWMRRIASSTLLQFLENPALMEDRVPTLGFYGAFEPAVQIYSCRGSVYWMGKAFLGLLLPADNPFWTAVENNGAWEKEFQPGKVYNKFMEGSNTLVTNYPNSGTSEIRAWCHEAVAKDWQKFRSTENYNKLSYNTAFPWMADSPDGKVSMNYAVLNAKQEWEVLRLYTFKKFEDGIYYRDAELETNPEIKFRLADIPLPNGILRVDKVSFPITTELRYGHYSLPELESPIVTKEQKAGGYTAYCMDNGAYQTALINLQGWSEVEFVQTEGLHPVSNKCSVINAATTHSGDKVFITLQLWKKNGKLFTKKELTPVKSFKQTGDSITIYFSDGTVKTVSLS
ncbi:DUF2264 domain-containing protein [Bacteroides intestinalis]|jgi:hypothetical protein|uniref:DUF2264 domain-containing protein n=1 Tax=Bacteroides intestinalis TaxID=329854 RepID=A0AB37MF67_9BACE|nr:DUF2264 domain-containing protein [Bacteroides intestinalis]QDO67486.1 DUF2264 domain-containing protein [Bacteroides intestinalis]RGK26077.1 DUF2264 domain-containing protein [Bacteroides intestinalis]RGX86273.1 DUF2264 domain-containing protein [Bacteroides intestinalis]RHN09413.1 DUF2264 domain-containing protein [Bacteroides intestinalis]UCB35714.1 DUF2264 domain-containing protein [Bacteroides intestinalis]